MRQQIALVITLVLLSCCKEDFTPPAIRTIDIVACKDSAVSLSKITDHIQYVALDIPEEYENPLGGEVTTQLTDKYILHIALYKTNEYDFAAPWKQICLIFDRTTGKFIGHIGGTKEWQTQNSGYEIEQHFERGLINVDETGTLFFSRYYLKDDGNYIQVWDIATQKPLSKISLKFHTKIVQSQRPINLSYFDNGNFLFFYGNTGVPEEKIRIFDKSEKIISTISYTPEQTYTPTPKDGFTRYVSFFKGEKLFYYTDRMDKYVYAINKEHHHFPLYLIDFGESTLPFYYFERTEDTDINYNKYALIQEVTGNDNYLFLRYRKKGISYFCIYQPENEYLSIHRGGRWNSRNETDNGIPNDIDGGLPFWPNAATPKGEFMAYYRTDSLRAFVDQAETSTIKDPSAREQLIKQLDKAPSGKYIAAIIQTKQP